MNQVELIKRRLKLKRHNLNEEVKPSKVSKYVNLLITRTLLAVIIFLSMMILTNKNNDVSLFLKKDVLTDNIPFMKITNLYNKYFGNIIPIKNEGVEVATVFNEHIKYNNIKPYKDGYELSVSDNYLVPIINSGIVVFIGEKDGYGKTIIIQGNDGVDYWYGNITNESVSLYDYVKKGNLLATSNKDKLYLVFSSNGEYLGYDEFIS